MARPLEHSRAVCGSPSPCLGCGGTASSATIAATTTLTKSQVGVIRWALDQLVDRVTLETEPSETEARDAVEASSLFALLEDAGNDRGQVLMLVTL